MAFINSALAAAAEGLRILPYIAQARIAARHVVRPKASAIARKLHRLLCVLLILSLLAASTPAAPRTIVAVVQEWRVSLAFWSRANGLSEKLSRALATQAGPERQEKQEDRDARISRIEIYPGDVTVRVEERVVFSAGAYDKDGAVLGGVRMKWSARDESRNRSARVSGRGEFEAIAPGTYKVIVEGAGRQTHVKVTVLDGTRKRKNEPPQKVVPVSTRDLPAVATTGQQVQSKGQQTASLSKLSKVPGGLLRPKRAHVSRTNGHRSSTRLSTATAAPLPLLPEEGWGSGNYPSADDPGNRRGDPPGQPLDDGAGSGNFQLAAPVLGLPGRGIDIALGLAYNSRVWNKSGTAINFDIDRDWPAPGWSLGFGKVADMGSGGSMIIDADGTRHAYSGTLTIFSYGQQFDGHTTDGTLINYSTWKNASGVMTWAEVNLPNGTQIKYDCQGPGGMFPTQIIDAQGNYITITYVNNAGPRIQTVTDTLGRLINFHYDSSNLLTAITTPGLGSGTRTLIRLHYRQLSLSYSFTGTPVVRDSYPWVIDAIYYPATNTGYWFGDSDSYSTYGMLAKVVEQRAMSLSASSLNEQGTVTQGQMTRKELYNYPLSPNDPGGSYLTDAPTYTSLSETWTRDGVNTDQAVTNYEVRQDSTPRTVTITLPNSTTSKQYSYNLPGQFNDGFVYLDETRDSAGTLLQSSSAEWASGAYDSARPSRLTATNERGQMTATEFTYGDFYNQVTEVRNYDYGGTALLRKTLTQYQNSGSYTTNRHIFNLPLAVEVFAADNTRVSRTEYQYDGQTLTDTPDVVMHADNHNPYAPYYQVEYCVEWDPNYINCLQYSSYWTSDYNPVTDYRGNVTQITTYANASTEPATLPTVETRRYDITGNLVRASTSCCQETSFNYTTATQYAYPLSQTRGSATDSFAQVTTSATYDFNTGLVLSATDANGRTSETSYFAETLRPQTASLPSGAHTDYAYDDTAMTVTETTYLETHPTHTTVADQNVKLVNGRGQVRQEKALGANSVWDIVDEEYDSMGRAFRQSRPYRSGTPQWSNVSYDALGRTKKVIAPDYTLPDASDGSTTETFYNETNRPSVASTLPGETTRVRDAWGRERWGRTDAEGRLVEVVEPNPSGSGSVFEAGALLTTYTYSTLGNLIQITQGAQTRSFKYDSLGRLTAQKLAEASATLNDAGAYVGSGTWSDVFTYDGRSNLTSRTDARGVKTVYNYNNDPLNRLQAVSWDTSGFGDSTNPILSAATVSYQYRTKSSGSQLRDVTQPSGVTTTGISSESYVYDSEDRVSSRTLTLTSRPSHPFVTDYIFDTLDRITDIRYPAEYGNGAQPRKVVHHDYDVASRLTGLTVDGAAHASQIVYNAASQTTSLKVGLSGANQITENYAYNSQTGLLDNQTVARGPATLLNLSYDYLRAGTGSGRTGQLTKILSNLNHNKDRGYAYDALGRLTQATGGPASEPLWTQTYSYDRYGNRTTVSANGSSARNRGSSPTVKEGSSDIASADPGSAGILPAMSALSVPPAVAGGSSAAIAQPADPKVTAPTEQLAASTGMELPDSLRTSASRSTSNSHHASRSVLGSTAAPQGSPPVFTDDPLVPGVTIIKAVHITELRTAVNQARSLALLPAVNWAENISQGVTLIKAAHIVELRMGLDGARAALGMSPANYTDPTLTVGVTTVKAVHIQELRQRVTEALSGSSSQIPPDGHASLAYDSATNRITTAGFAYDKAGNQVQAQIAGGVSQRFQYDAANRLVKVKTDNNQTVIASYTYGDSNERLILEEAGVRTYYASDGSVEYTESGSSTTPQWSKTYIYLGARLLSTLTPNGSGGQFVQYHHPDRLGTRLVTNAQDTNYFEQQTLPFGTALNESPPAGGTTGATNRRFTTYDRSLNTGLDYAVNRHYDPQQGRFTQVDPIGMRSTSLASPQTLNLYAYCTNDPINQIDPSGLGFLSKIFKAIGKAIKIIAIVLVVVVVVALVIYAAPAGAALISFAEFLLFKAAPVLAKVLAGLTGFHTGSVTLGPGGTPTWNPKAGKIGGFGWDHTTDVITTTTSCRNNWPASDGPNCPGAPWYKRIWEGIKSAKNAVDDYLNNDEAKFRAARWGAWWERQFQRYEDNSSVETYPGGPRIGFGLPAVGAVRNVSVIGTKGYAKDLFRIHAGNEARGLVRDRNTGRIVGLGTVSRSVIYRPKGGARGVIANIDLATGADRINIHIRR